MSYKQKAVYMMQEYIKDFDNSDTPFNKWEFKLCGSDTWEQCKEHPRWYDDCEYRRIKVPLGPGFYTVQITDTDGYDRYPLVKEIFFSSEENALAYCESKSDDQTWYRVLPKETMKAHGVSDGRA